MKKQKRKVKIKITDLDKIRNLITPILKEHGAAKAGIFGSVARGEARKNSDIDILIQFRGKKSLLDLVGLKLDLEERTKKKFDILTYDSIHPLLKEDNILKEEVRIYEKNEKTLLMHIAESAEIIEDLVKNTTRGEFTSSINIQDSAVRRLEIIAGLRDILIHV